MKLCQYLDTVVCRQGHPTTHTSFKGGKYCIPDDDYDVFLRLYARLFEERREHLDMSIVERHRAPMDESTGPVVIDLDFRMTSLVRPYTLLHIQEFIDILTTHLQQWIRGDVDFTCYILEKTAPRQDAQHFKDGIHLIFPHVVTCPHLQFGLRSRFLQDHPSFFHARMPDLTSSCTTDSIYDQAVIWSNGLFLLGSKKPKEPYCWLPTHTYLAGNALGARPVRCCYDPALVALFSLRNKTKACKLTPDGEAMLKPIKEEPTLPDASPPRPLSWVYKHIDELLGLLSVERATKRELWFNVMVALKNIDSSDDMMEAFLRFSRKAPDSAFDPDGCVKTWDSYTPQHIKRPLTFKSLCFWAWKDDPEGAKRLFRTADMGQYDRLSAPLRPSIRSDDPDYQHILCHEKLLDPCHLDFDLFDILILWSRLGTGKTRALIQALLKHGLNNILIISPRVTFTMSIHERMKVEDQFFELYFELQQREFAGANKLIISPESLHRLDRIHYDLVILDEIEAINLQLSSKTVRDKAATASKLFLILFQARKIIACDGAISPRTIQMFKEVVRTEGLAGSRKRMAVIHNQNTAKVQNRQLIHLQPENHKDVSHKLVSSAAQREMVRRILEDLAAGKKIVMFSANRNFAERLFQVLPQNTRALLITSKSSDQEKREVGRVNSVWAQQDIVIYSATITIGVSCEVIHFDCMYAWLDPATVCCRTAIQAFHRVRHLKDNTVYMYIAPISKYRHVMTNMEDWRHHLRIQERIIHTEFQRLMEEQEAVPIWQLKQLADLTPQQQAQGLKALLDRYTTPPAKSVPDIILENEVYNKTEADLDFLHHDKGMYYFLDLEGYNITTQTFKVQKKKKKKSSDITLPKAYKGPNFNDIQDVDFQQYSEAKRRINLKQASKTDHLVVQKHDFCEMMQVFLPGTSQEHVGKLFQAMQDRDIKQWVTNALWELRGAEECTGAFRSSVNTSQLLLFTDTIAKQALYIQDITSLLGLPNSLDNNQTVIRQKDIMAVSKELGDKVVKLCALMNVPCKGVLTEYKHLSGKLRTVFRQWNGSKFVRQEVEGHHKDSVYRIVQADSMQPVNAILLRAPTPLQTAI